MHYRKTCGFLDPDDVGGAGAGDVGAGRESESERDSEAEEGASCF